MFAVVASRFSTFRLGQPTGFNRICLTKFWERLAYYGLQSILILYLTEHLFTVRVPEEIWFLATISEAFGIKGQALASSITGGFLMLMSIIPILGGIITDRIVGNSRAIIFGGSIMALGHLLMAFEPALILALLCIALGVGLFRGAIASELAQLYDTESRRVEGFQLYFLAVNLAGLAAPLLIGTIGEEIGWHWGFATAGGAMITALAIYMSMRGREEADALLRTQNPDIIGPVSNAPRWGLNISVILAVGLLAIPNFQLFNAYMIWVKRDFALQIFGQNMPVSWLIGLDAALSFSVLVASVPFWRFIEPRLGSVSSLSRAGFGSLFVCAGAATLVLAASMAGDGELSLLWCMLFQLLNAIGLAQILPAVMAMLGSRENAGGSATSISGYFFGLFIAGFISTLLAARFDSMALVEFWILHLGCAVAGAAVLFSAQAILRTSRLRSKQPVSGAAV